MIELPALHLLRPLRILAKMNTWSELRHPIPLYYYMGEKKLGIIVCLWTGSYCPSTYGHWVLNSFPPLEQPAARPSVSNAGNDAVNVEEESCSWKMKTTSFHEWKSSPLLP